MVLICSPFLLTSFFGEAADLMMLAPPLNTDPQASTISSLPARSFPVACFKISSPASSITSATFSWFKEKMTISFWSNYETPRHFASTPLQFWGYPFPLSPQRREALLSPVYSAFLKRHVSRFRTQKINLSRVPFLRHSA